MQKILLCFIIWTIGICLFIFLTDSISPLPVSNEFDEVFVKPIILEWNKYWTEIPYHNLECTKHCFFTNNTSFEKDATLITFHYHNMNSSNLPKTINYNRMNVFVEFESPANYPYSKSLPDSFFNATVSYMQNSDYPILYDCFKNLKDNDEDRWNNNEIEIVLSKKTKSIVTFVSNCQTNSKREFLIPVFETYINITKYGSCYNKNECQTGTNCEKEELENHFFVLALENSHCTDYFSEKVWRLRNLVVPIIMDRTLLQGELAYLNPYVIALSDFKTVKGLAEYLTYLINNKDEYKKYFEWTKFYQKSNSCGMIQFPCGLCELAMKVKFGYRKEMNARIWWNDGILQDGYVKTWLKSAFKNTVNTIRGNRTKYNSTSFQPQKFQSKINDKNFVILSTTTMPRYRFLLPVAVTYWNKLGVQVIVFLVKDNNSEGSEFQDTIKILKELNAIIKIVHSNKLSAISLSQVIRLFGAVLLPSINQQFTDNSTLIVSDADLVAFNLTNHVPDVANGKTLHIHNIDCCIPSKVPPMRGNHEVKMYAMSTIGATVKTWKEIMGLNKTVLSIDEIEECVIAEFGNDFFHSSDEFSKIHGNFVWTADQSLISYKIDEWLKTSNNNDTLTYEWIPFSRRIDRSAWPTPEQFAKMKIEDYDDCHQPTAAYSSGEWEKYKPFLEFAFKNDKKFIKRFSEYREGFAKYD